MKRWVRRLRRALAGRDKGTVAVTFLLSLPILLTIIGVIVQFALLATARLTVDRAVAAAARSAMVALPTDPAIDARGGMPVVLRAAFMALEPLSPASPNASAEGQTVAEAMRQAGMAVPASYAARFAYAQGATVVTIEALDANDNPVIAPVFAQTAAPRVRLTIAYRYQLTVPAIGALIGQAGNVGGVSGRFFTLRSSQIMQLSDGREAGSQVNGVP